MSKTIDEGLVFSIPLSEGQFGFGQLIAYQDPIFYMIAYDVQSGSPSIENERLQLATPVLMGNFFDVLIRNERWKPIRQSSIPSVTFPCFIVRIGSEFYVESWDRERRREATARDIAVLQPRADYGPIILENALKAHFGFEAWESAFDPLRTENVAPVANIC